MVKKLKSGVGIGFVVMIGLAIVLMVLYQVRGTDTSQSDAGSWFGLDGRISKATKRAIDRGYDGGSEWYAEFRYSELKGDLAPQDGVVRRDPSNVIWDNGLHYVYYTKSVGPTYGFGTGNPENKVFPWDKSDIWYATSVDGWEWQEKGIVIRRGTLGDYDDRSVFTPQVLVHGDQVVLVYQAVKAPYTNRVKNVVAMATATSPAGPFEKLAEPIFSPSTGGRWFGEEDNRFKAIDRGAFDSQKVHDPTLIPYKGQYYLYYKGEQMGERLTMGGREVRWGVAVSDELAGPYYRSPFNPITNSGNQVCVWRYQGGITALLSSNGPERNTIQWAPDGINFEIKSYLLRAPSAVGLFESGNFEEDELSALESGLTHFDENKNKQYILRFDRIPPAIP